MNAPDAWLMNLIALASTGTPPVRAAAIRALWVNHSWTVEEINEVCSIDLATIRWALNHAPVVKEKP